MSCFVADNIDDGGEGIFVGEQDLENQTYHQIENPEITINSTKVLISFSTNFNAAVKVNNSDTFSNWAKTNAAWNAPSVWLEGTQVAESLECESWDNITVELIV